MRYHNSTLSKPKLWSPDRITKKTSHSCSVTPTRLVSRGLAAIFCERTGGRRKRKKKERKKSLTSIPDTGCGRVNNMHYASYIYQINSENWSKYNYHIQFINPLTSFIEAHFCRCEWKHHGLAWKKWQPRHICFCLAWVSLRKKSRKKRILA